MEFKKEEYWSIQFKTKLRTELKRGSRQPQNSQKWCNIIRRKILMSNTLMDGSNRKQFGTILFWFFFKLKTSYEHLKNLQNNLHLSIPMTKVRNIFFLFLLSLFFYSCESSNKCSLERKNITQVFHTKNESFLMLRIDYGASGYNAHLEICEKNSNILIEEIGLRGEDYLPTIDSVRTKTIYLHYNFPRENESIKQLDFDAVVLGEALLNRGSIKMEV